MRQINVVPEEKLKINITTPGFEVWTFGKNLLKRNCIGISRIINEIDDGSLRPVCFSRPSSPQTNLIGRGLPPHSAELLLGDASQIGRWSQRCYPAISPRGSLVRGIFRWSDIWASGEKPGARATVSTAQIFKRSRSRQIGFHAVGITPNSDLVFSLQLPRWDFLKGRTRNGRVKSGGRSRRGRTPPSKVGVFCLL